MDPAWVHHWPHHAPSSKRPDVWPACSDLPLPFTIRLAIKTVLNQVLIGSSSLGRRRGLSLEAGGQQLVS